MESTLEDYETQLVHANFYSGKEIDGGRDLNLLDRITVDPEIMQGKPCIRGMRITVSLIIGLLASGCSFNEILELYPEIEEEDILQSINYAYVLCGGHYESIGN